MKRLPGLDLLRAVAIAWVMLYHAIVMGVMPDGNESASLIGRWRVPGAGAIAAMAYSLYLTHKQTYHLTQMVVGARLDGSPILAVLVYGGTALAAGALLSAVGERPALIVRDRILTRHGTTTFIPHSRGLTAGADAGTR